jgi:DNA polymerase-3 subunit gamma/tau
MAASDSEPAEFRLPLGADAPAGRAGYVVVARRYRPQAFDELVGQEHVARALSGAIAADRVGHAYLFTGARGVGKTSAARILAKALDCERGPTATPCNRCDLCTSIAAGSDVDVIEIDGASNRGIDEIRQLRQNVNIRPSRARYKIYIIDEVHMLTREAFNALLKTLEEPPEHVKFIFCTTEVTKIPITILSRCQRFDFAGIGLPSIVGRLRQIVDAEGVSAESEALEIIARRAAGSMRDSQSLLEQLLAFGDQKITAAEVHAMLGTAGEARLSELVSRLVEHDAAAALAIVDTALAEAVDIGQLLEQLLGYFRDLLAAAVGCAPEALTNTSAGERDQLASTARRLGAQTILAIMQIIDHTLARMRYSTQGRTLAEMALVRIAMLEDLEALADLVAQVRGGQTLAALPGSVDRPPRTITEAKKKGESSAIEALAVADGPTPPDRSALLATDTSARDALELSAQNVEGVWRQTLSGLSGLLPEQAATCDSVSLAGPDRLAVTFQEKYNSCKAFCERAEHHKTLEQALADVVGRAVRIEYVLIKDKEASPKAARPTTPGRHRLNEHSLVRRAGELFDARVVRVEESDARE